MHKAQRMAFAQRELCRSVIYHYHQVQRVRKLGYADEKGERHSQVPKDHVPMAEELADAQVPKRDISCPQGKSAEAQAEEADCRGAVVISRDGD